VREELKLYASALLILLCLAALLGLVAEYGFPLHAYIVEGLPRLLIPLKLFKEVSSAVGRFLWDWRTLDLLSQAFVILAAVVCCLALLKPEVEER